MLRNLGFDDIHSASIIQATQLKISSPSQPSVVLIDGNSNQIATIKDILHRLISPSKKTIPVILLLTSRELKREFLSEFHPYVASVLFKPVSSRLLHHQLRRFLHLD